VPVGPTRRAVLAGSAAAAALLVSACRGVQVLGPPPPAPADVRQLRDAIDAERLMISRYAAAIARATAAGTPGQGAVTALTGLLAEHRQHLAQLSSRLIEPAGSSPQPLRAPRTAMPPGLSAAIGVLEVDEQDASNRLAAQLLAVPPSLAQLMASISASEATHVPVLHGLRLAR
jgi:hypothetical protein